jgi:P27 family predicted phage terminase small subunit
VTGRPKDPTRERRQTGHRRKPGEAPKLAVVPFQTADQIEYPPPPADLEEAAHPIWVIAVQELAHRGLKAVDLEAVRQLCTMALRARQAGANIAKYGLMVEGAYGPIANPMLKIERDASAAYVRLATEFGLTFASRLRLGLFQLAGQSLTQQLAASIDGPAELPAKRVRNTTKKSSTKRAAKSTGKK